MDPANAQLWWGVAFSTSNQFGVAGFSRILARIFEVGGQKYDCVFQADQWRVGPGLGGNLGATFLVGLNVRKPGDLRTALGSSSLVGNSLPDSTLRVLGPSYQSMALTVSFVLLTRMTSLQGTLRKRPRWSGSAIGSRTSLDCRNWVYH